MKVLTRLAVGRPLTAYMLMFIAVVAGIATYLGLPRESFPEIRVPLIMVSTVYPGTAPSDMENQVTRKIEMEVKGISGIKEIRLTSRDGYSLVEVEFTPDVVLDTALQKVREAVDRAKPEMPQEIEDPVVTDVDFSRFPILLINLAGDFGMDRLKEIADDLKDELEAIQGVNLVNIVGGRDREVQVLADPRRLTALELGLPDLVEAVAKEHLTVPGGDLDVGRLNFLVRVPGEVENPLEIADFVVAVRNGSAIKVRDVATVAYGFEEEATRARMNGRRSITLTIEKRTGANIVAVAERVRAEVERLRETLPPAAEVEILRDQSEDIASMNRELENSILSGLLLVLIVLFFAMGWRPALIVAAAIPFSMLISFIVVAFLGYTLNMVILFSFVLVLGMLVDNAVVTVENIYRHRELGDPAKEAALLGTGEVTMPIIAATATTICAFGPMLLWPGIIGEFMKYLPMTLIIGLAASLFVALVFNPAIAAGLLRRPPAARRRRKGELGRFTGLYKRLLSWALDHDAGIGQRFVSWVCAFAISALGVGAFLMQGAGVSSALVFAAWGLIVGLFVLAALFLMRDNRVLILLGMGLTMLGTLAIYSVHNEGTVFFPDTSPREIWVDFEFPPGTNLEGQDALVTEVERRTADTTDMTEMITNVGSTGSGMMEGGSGGASNESRVTLNLLKFHERAQDSRKTLNKVKELLAGLSGAQIKVDKPVEGPSQGKPVSLRLIGEDYDELGELADQLAAEMATIPGLYNVDHDYDRGYPELRIDVDREEAARAKLDTRSVAGTVRTALAGTEVAKYRTGEDEFEIRVKLPKADRLSGDALEELTILDEDGRPIPLRSIAKIHPTAGPSAIRRLDMKRVVAVEGDVDYDGGYRDNVLRAAAAEKLEALTLPPGVRWEFGGAMEDEQESSAFLMRVFMIALLLISLILVTEFDSLITPLTILVSVILSLIGVFWGLMITGTPFGIVMTGIGVISLAGIVVNNAIVLCDFVIQERKKGTPKREAILAAGVTRLRPVLLTAITTILGLIPLTTGINIDFFAFDFSLGGESKEWWGPMGIAVIFGLAVATVLTLVVVPITYDLLDGITSGLTRRRTRKDEGGESETLEEEATAPVA